MAEQRHNARLADPGTTTVVQDYLDFMLREATQPRPAETVTEQSRQATAPEPEVEQDVRMEPALESESGRQSEPARASFHAPPEWAATGFPGLLFRVRGLDMAVPLIHLGGIASLDTAAVKPVAGQASWFIGLMRWNRRTIRVVDTDQLLSGGPEVEEKVEGEPCVRGYRSVIVLHGTDWGLAMDEPGESRTLQPDDIRWRYQRGSRPWLAGTLSGSLRSLLDTAAIIERLTTVARKLQDSN